MAVYILKSDNNSFERYFSKKMQDELSNIIVLPVYKCANTVLGDYLVQKIVKMGEKYECYCYGKWKNLIKDGDTIIVFDNLFSNYILEYLRKMFPSSRIIFWLWNIGNHEEILKFKDIVELWCFDKAECERYGYHYNIQFHVGIDFDIPDQQTYFDFVYVGRDKGRQEILKQIVENLKSESLTYDINIVKPERKEAVDFHYYNRSLKYKRYLQMLSKGKVIIDITQNNQEGLTLRLIEALILKKKILTNNYHYTEFGIIDRKDIFVWGVDDVLRLREFCDLSFYSTKEIDFLSQWYCNFEI